MNIEIPQSQSVIASQQNSNTIDESSKQTHAITDQIDTEAEVNDVSKRAQEKVSEMTPERLESVAQQLQDFVSSLDKSLQFSTHKDSGRDVIKVIDGMTGETLRQIPSEEILDVVSNLSKASGILMETKV